mgnify:FL=1
MKKGYGVGRGFTGGLLWGLLAAVLCLFCFVAYQSLKPEESPEAITLEVPAGSEFNHSRDDKAAKSPTKISTANRAQVFKSELLEPNLGSGIDKAIGSSVKAPTAEANTLSSLSSTSSIGSEISVQRSLSLGEKPAFALRSLQRPLAPRAESTVSINSETPKPLPKQEIILQQKVQTKLPTPDLKVSIDPKGPNLTAANLSSIDESPAKLGEENTLIDLPKDQTTEASQFTELDIQVSPQLPDTDFSVMINTTGSSTLPQTVARNIVSEANRDEIKTIDFSNLKSADQHTGFANPTLPISPKLPNIVQTQTQDTLGPKMQQSELISSRSSEGSLSYTNIDKAMISPALQNQAPNSFVPNDPQPLDYGPEVQNTDIEPSKLEKDITTTGFGKAQSNIKTPLDNNVSIASKKTENRLDNAQNPTINTLGVAVTLVPSQPLSAIETLQEPQSFTLEPSPSLPVSNLEQPSFSTITSGSEETRPIDVYAMSKVPTEDKPVLAIVLVVDGKNQIDIQALKEVPFPISLAVPISSFEGDKLMNFYRSNGFEVAAIFDYPNAISAEEINQILTTGIERLNKAVAIIEGSPGILQKTRTTSAQTAKILQQTGHGLLVYDKGLNTIVREAKKLGVPVGTIYRDFDKLKGGSRTIRRFLDGAAFRASQKGENSAIVITASLSPETLGALLLWSMQSRSQTVTMTPLSQALTLEN